MQDEDSIPYGFCHCTCGERTKIATQTDKSRGWVKGEPILYVGYHANRVVTAERRANLSAGQIRRFEDPLQRAAVSGWKLKDGRIVTSSGYVALLVGEDHPMAAGRYALEHRLVMAEHVGRMLRPEEVVHHKTKAEGGSGCKDDNRIENLVLFPSNSAHGQHHSKLRRAARGIT